MDGYDTESSACCAFALTKDKAGLKRARRIYIMCLMHWLKSHEKLDVTESMTCVHGGQDHVPKSEPYDKVSLRQIKSQTH